MADEGNFLWERDMDGESLVKNLLSNHDSGYTIVIDDKTHKYYTIDKSKKYHVRVTEHSEFNGIVWNYTILEYRIKEIK